MSRPPTLPSPARSPASLAASQREPSGRSAWISRVALATSSERSKADCRSQFPSICWDGNGGVFYTTLGHPDLLVYLYEFGLGVPNPRTLLELTEAERFLHRNAHLGFEQHTSWHFVRTLRSDEWGFDVPDKLLNQEFVLYLRTLVWHLQDSQRRSPPPYQDASQAEAIEDEGGTATSH